MLGVFVLAFFFRRVGGRGAFYGVLAGEAVIFACYFFTGWIAFLWYNVIGCLVVVADGLLISRLEQGAGRSAQRPGPGTLDMAQLACPPRAAQRIGLNGSGRMIVLLTLQTSSALLRPGWVLSVFHSGSAPKALQALSRAVMSS